MKSQKTIRILSLDGGGARGLLQIHFLERLFYQMGITSAKNNFDLIAGTSVGSIIAAGLNIMSPTELKTFFLNKAPYIFTIRTATDVLANSKNASQASNRPNAIQKASMLIASDPFYKAVSSDSNYGDSFLKQSLIEVFGEKQLTDLTIPTIIPAHNYTKRHPIVFSNAKVSAVPEKYREIGIVDAILSSAAAPIYFPSHPVDLDHDPETEPDTLIDGGLFQNNPSTLAYHVAQMLFPNAKRFCVLSVGTGTNTIELPGNLQNIPAQDAPENSIKKYLKLLDIAMSNAEIANDLFFRSLAELSMDTNVFYYRFNIELDSNQDCELDNSSPEFFEYLQSAVDKKYLDDMFEIGQFISRLTDKDGDDGIPSSEVGEHEDDTPTGDTPTGN